MAGETSSIYRWAISFSNPSARPGTAPQSQCRDIVDLKDAESDRKAAVLTPEAFAVLWYLKRQGVGEAQNVAQEAASTLEQYPHWSTSSHQEQEVRKGLKP